MSTATAIILDALEDVNVDALVTKKHAQQLAEELADALEVRGYALRKKPAPRKPAEPVEAFAPNTGDAALDDFMRKHHDPKYRPAPMPKAPGMPSIGIPAKQRDMIEASWTQACNARRENEAMRAEDAETLREVIALHRSPWRYDRMEVYSGESHRVHVSPRHPGIEIWVRDNRTALAQLYVDGKRITPAGGFAFAPREAEKAADSHAAERAA